MTVVMFPVLTARSSPFLAVRDCGAGCSARRALLMRGLASNSFDVTPGCRLSVPVERHHSVCSPRIGGVQSP